ncbi:transcriptional regulator [Aliidongia dinghuensis]|uniref:Transcriptional regulator n=1 Tax=Aliidongia dinghuensis TaxID=1867774 RepID=A0A8J2YUD6_9PROT|nr:helix-turn-helix transcriptional regulator [Aliidongia dinghuensis]GGF23301.1 transcriptional regulator [Aliidongia dinghuensis]
MRDTPLDPYEDLPRDVVVTANDYPARFVYPVHAHRRGQFAFAATGVASVVTESGNWVVPPGRGFWVPAGVSHSMRMSGPVTMLNAFIRPEAAGAARLPTECQVLGVSPLLRDLLVEATDVEPVYAEDQRAGRIMALLLDEIAAMRPLGLNAPLPAEPRLARLCRAVLDEPSLEVDIDEMARRAGMSRRSFTRAFRRETGTSFALWRQQACLLSAIVRLGEGEQVTQIALDLGYGSTSAFSAAFRRVLGASPSRYLKRVADR